MKTKHLFLVVLFLLSGSVVSEIQAQTNIKAVIKKCETLDNVDMSRVRNKERVITSVNFKNNDALMNEILDALKKDETTAEQIIESKVNGKMVPTFYRFDKGTFSLNIDQEKKTVSATLIEREGGGTRNIEKIDRAAQRD